MHFSAAHNRPLPYFCALVARRTEDETVTAQDVGGTRNVKHHGQQKGTHV